MHTPWVWRFRVHHRGAGCAGEIELIEGHSELQSSAVYWHAENFRYLPSMRGDLATFVSGLPHPNSGGYGKVSSTREASFNAFLDALFEAIDASLADGATGDWCGVQSRASSAGYAVRCFYDTVTGRWFVYAYDTTSYGQAYFFINPMAKRNIIVEVPHEPYDMNTGVEGARIFTAIATRALLVNEEHRCSDPDATICAGTTSACGGYFRESDVPHHHQNTFHLLHKVVQQPGSVRPVRPAPRVRGLQQRHGRDRRRDHQRPDPQSVSVGFASNLDKYVPPRRPWTPADRRDETAWRVDAGVELERVGRRDGGGGLDGPERVGAGSATTAGCPSSEGERAKTGGPG